MASVITIMNMKGGVGKTIVAAHLAGMLAHYSFNGKQRRVLAIDYDAQFNLSQMFIEPTTYSDLDRSRKTSLAILQDDEMNLDPYALQVPGNRNPPRLQDLVHPIYGLANNGLLDIIPSSMDLMYVALGQSSERTDPIEERFDKFITECRGAYDVVIIDCHPAGSILTKTALQNSDHVIIPVTPSPFAARGIGLMMRFLEANKIGSSGAFPHVLFNKEKGPPSSSQLIIRGNPRFVKHCLAAPLERFTAFSDPNGGKDFVWFSGLPYSRKARNNLMSVVQEIVTRTGC